MIYHARDTKKKRKGIVIYQARDTKKRKADKKENCSEKQRKRQFG